MFKRCSTAAVVFVLAASTIVWADKTGIEVGAKAPDFKLKDQNGKSVSLSELVKQGRVAIVFHRSADW